MKEESGVWSVYCLKRKRIILFVLLLSTVFLLHALLYVHKTKKAQRLKQEHASHLLLTEDLYSKIFQQTEEEEEPNEEALQAQQKTVDSILSKNTSKSSAPAVSFLRVPSHYHNALVPPIYKRDVGAFKKYQAYLQEKEELRPLQTRVVIILTNYRSGSSFFGELLNQHPDVFYFFEPLLLLKNDCDENKLLLKLDILKAVSQCVIPDYAQLHRNLTLKHDNVELNRNVYVCTKRKFCFAPFTKELCEERHCPKPRGFNKSSMDCWKHCGVINVNSVENDCRRKKFSAVKIIRLCDIESLKPLVDDAKLDVKVLHLIRDPRGIANSRRLLHPKLDLAQSLKFTCGRQAQNAKTGMFIQPDWLRDKYKLFRYEDVALRPYQTAQTVYDFLGLSFPHSMKQWIQGNTKLPIPNDSFFHNISHVPAGAGASETNNTPDISKELFSLKRFKAMGDPWGHARDSKQVVQKWKRQLKYSDAVAVQEVCNEIMELTGYLPVTSEASYLNKNNVYLDSFSN